MHLAYELLDGPHSTLVLVDAVSLDDPAGTLAVLEVDPAGAPTQCHVLVTFRDHGGRHMTDSDIPASSGPALGTPHSTTGGEVRVIPDDRDRARLAQIERQLTVDDEPELAQALETWRPVRMHRTCWLAWTLLVTGVLSIGLAVVVSSVGWGFFAALTLGGWYWLRTERLPSLVVVDASSCREDAW